MLDPQSIRFRKLQLTDMQQMHVWLNLPHVTRWFTGASTFVSVVMQYKRYIDGVEPVEAYLTLYDADPIGYIQAWRVKDYPNYKPYYDLPDAVVGVDMFIGEEDYLYRGLGGVILRQFVETIVFADPNVPFVIIDPACDNTPAMQAFTRAGFQHVKTFVFDSKALCLMRLNRPQP